MQFRPPAQATPGRSAIALYTDDGDHVATIYAVHRGIHIVSAAGWEPDARTIAVELQEPRSIDIGFGINEKHPRHGQARRRRHRLN